MRARRSCLSVPAHPASKLAKGTRLQADEVIVDLEDSVPSELKEEARAAVVNALRTAEWTAATVSVRVNDVSTAWCDEDIRAVVGAGNRLHSIVIPKVERAASLVRIEQLLTDVETGIERTQPVATQALIETARGLRDSHEIATASPRIEALILGPADMSVSLGFPSPDEGRHWDFVRGTVLVAARAAHLQAIDGPYLQVNDIEGLRESAGLARKLGYDGKWALHPAQVAVLDDFFTPSDAELGRARAILKALEDANGVTMLDGEMIDEASRKRAEQLLARARASAKAKAI
jgi:citrate lyase subunit beta/citryl-CoA lyase